MGERCRGLAVAVLALVALSWRLQTGQSWTPLVQGRLGGGRAAAGRLHAAGGHGGLEDQEDEGSDKRRRAIALALAAGVGSASIGGLPWQAFAEEEAASTPEGDVDRDSSSPPPESGDGLAADFPRVTVPYKSKDLPLTKFIGKATVVVNVKTDDPEAVKQYPALGYLNEQYASKGLRVLAFPTEQGWYEAEISDIVRLRALQSYSFGQFPFSVVFDKVDLLGSTAHPLFKYLMSTLKNPNGRGSISLNFEKFLLDEHGVPVRRYPRKYTGFQMERDVAALLNGQELPPPSPTFEQAWVDAAREAIKSEYAFRKGYNVYRQDEPSTDWQGIEEEGFR